MDANPSDCLKEHPVVRLYRAALCLFPAGYRHEFGEELLYAVSMAAADAQAQGEASLWRFAWRELRDLPLALLRAQLRERRAPGNLHRGVYLRGWLVVIGILVALLIFPAYVGVSLGYTDTKGPFKDWLQVVDWEGDGDLDLIVSHTRWEQVSESWAGVGIWLNQGAGKFELRRDWGKGDWPFGGFAAGAADVDQDGDLDVFTDFGIRLMVNMGGLQGGEPGAYRSIGGIKTPPAYDSGYQDMGGTISMGDLNEDGRIDAFLAGCCYGTNPMRPGNDYPYAPSVSWVWINDGVNEGRLGGHIIPMDSLDGRPIRQVALGDVDGDGDMDVFAAVGKPTMGSVVSLDDLVLLNDGTGKLVLLDQPLGNTDSTSVALGDVNGDGRLDALVGSNPGARVWLNQGNSPAGGGPVLIPTGQSFDALQTSWNRLQAGFSTLADKLFGLYFAYGSTRTKAVFLADFDGDGDLDALIARTWGAEVWWNDGGGEFRRSGVQLGFPEDTGVAVADFDGDGDLDIFSGGNEQNGQVWLNDGKGVFRAANR
jgi:hypothetical protein